MTTPGEDELRDARDDRERARAMVLIGDALWLIVEAFLRGDAAVNQLRGAMLRYDDARRKCDLTWANPAAAPPVVHASPARSR